MRLVITGCGRSGTQWITSVLHHLGLNISHERFFDHGVDPLTRNLNYSKSTWNVDAEASWLAVPFLHLLPNDVAIWHQLRNPYKVIQCWNSHKIIEMETVGKFIQKAIPECRLGSILNRTIAYYLRWNQMAAKEEERELYRRYWIEDLTAKTLQEMLYSIGELRTEEEIEKAMADSKGARAACGEHKPLSLEEIQESKFGEELLSVFGARLSV